MSPASSCPDEYENDAVPTYEESIQFSRFAQSEEKKAGSSFASSISLEQQLTETRARRIEDILSTYVNPLIFSLGRSGLYKATFLLVPSNVTALQTRSASMEPEIIGFPARYSANLVWLIGEEHTLEFWRQPAVMKELESRLKAQLTNSGHRVETNINDTLTRITDRVEPDETIQGAHVVDKLPCGKTKTRYISDTEDRDAESNDRRTELRHHNLGSQSSVLPPGKIRVQVQWKDICLRLQTEMGLYDTRKGPALCLSIEVGS